jgi:hypothetical protein
MANTIRLRRSAVPSAQPTTAQLALGEVAINTYDGKLYIKKNNGTESIVEIGAGGGGGASVSTSETPPASPSDGDLWWNTQNGVLYIWYVDTDSGQWVSIYGLSSGGGGGGSGVEAQELALSGDGEGPTTFTYTSGTLTGITETVFGGTRTTSLTYTSGTLTSMSRTFGGATRTFNYVYTGGVLTGITVS